jgi:hypothetical protein
VDKMALSTTVVLDPSPSRSEWTTSCKFFATPKILGDPVFAVTSTYSMLIVAATVFGFFTFTPNSRHVSNLLHETFDLSI